MAYRNIKVIRDNDKQEIVPTGLVAHSFWKRLGGLLVLPPLEQHSCLILEPCMSVHTFWMKYPIDVVFLDRRQQIVDLYERLTPGRMVACLKAKSVVELPPGAINAQRLSIGQKLSFHEI